MTAPEYDLDAALHLVDIWREALDASFRLGYQRGEQVGRWAAEREMAEAWASAAHGVSATLRQPTFAELQRRRGVPTEPCPTSCGRCSRCIYIEYRRRHRSGVAS